MGTTGSAASSDPPPPPEQLSEKVSKKIDHEIILIEIIKLEEKWRNLEKKAINSVECVKYQEATRYYKLAADTASKTFKMGKNDAMKDIKRLTNKAKEQVSERTTGIHEGIWENIRFLEEDSVLNPDFKVKMLDKNGRICLDYIKNKQLTNGG